MEFKTIGVAGCGLMGHGIAQVFAAAGRDVIVFERDGAALNRGIERIRASLEKLTTKLVERGKLSEAEASQNVENALARITPTEDIRDLAAADLVVEAIVEDLAAKHALFRELDAVCRPECVFASNTSSFPIHVMAGATSRADRFVGMHFFNPVQLMPLVEVVSTPDTREGLAAAVHDFVAACGKTPILCGDTPGFVVNRLLVPLMVQAMLMLDRGDATQEAIDTAMQLGAAHPMGPLTLADYVGLDTTLAILEGWVERHPDEPAFQVPDCLRERVARGDLGRKTGRGFYEWQGDRRVDARPAVAGEPQR